MSIFLFFGLRKNFRISVASFVFGGVESIPHGPDSWRDILSRDKVINWSKTSLSAQFLTLSLERFSG